jgi:hypothetical protein
LFERLNYSNTIKVIRLRAMVISDGINSWTTSPAGSHRRDAELLSLSNDGLAGLMMMRTTINDAKLNQSVLFK